MMFKIVAVAVIAIIGCSKGEDVWNGFTIKWALNVSDGFIPIPETLRAARSQGWTDISGVNPPKHVVALGYYDDPRVVVLYSKLGKAVGVQVGFPVADDSDPDQPLKFDELDAVIVKTLNGVLYYTGTAYFYKNESGGNRKIWFEEKGGLVEIPTKPSAVLNETSYLLKNCLPAMGTHYYTWHYDSDCATLSPWFLMSKNDEIIGFGFQGFGQISSAETRQWWETVPTQGLLLAVPDAPTCAQEGVAKYGIISLHVWFVANPETITCD